MYQEKIHLMINLKNFMYLLYIGDFQPLYFYLAWLLNKSMTAAKRQNIALQKVSRLVSIVSKYLGNSEHTLQHNVKE